MSRGTVTRPFIRRLPLSRTLPLLIIVIGLTSVLVSYLTTRALALEQILDEQTRFSKDQITRFQLVLETAGETQSPAFTQQLMSLAASSDVRLAFLISDSDGTVRTASEVDRVGLALKSLLPTKLAELAVRAQTELLPFIHFDEQTEILSAIARICTSRTLERRPKIPCGIAVFQRDLSLIIAEHMALLNQQLKITSAGILLTVITIILVLRSGLLNKLERLLYTLNRYESGEHYRRNGLQGDNEVARIGQAVDELLDHIEGAQEALSFSEYKFRALFENNLDGMIVMTDQGFISDINRIAADIFGYEKEELLGARVERLMPADDARHHASWVAGFVSTGHGKIIGQNRQLRAVRKSGESFPIKLGVGEVISGDARYFLATITDLSEVASLEQQLRRSQKMDAIGQLAGGVAHDFNNLLGIVIGNLDLLGRRLPDDEKLQKHLNKALGAATRGADLTRRLLGFSRKRSTSSDTIDINKVLESLQDLLSRSVTSTIRIDMQLSEEPSAANLDPGQLEDVLINLILNARDAMPNGGAVKISTRTVVLDQPSTLEVCHSTQPGEFVEIAITDSGCGIPDNHRDQIFEPFFSTKAEGKGTGLGLAMVYGFIKRFHGCLAVESALNVGTTFRLYLPKSDPSLLGTASAPTLNMTLPSGSETILIVDDEPELLELADNMLTELGYRTVLAGNGEQALIMLERENDIDVVFSDVVMPGSLDGFGLAEIITARWPHIKVLLASGFTGKLSDRPASKRWQRDVMTKPYREAELALRIRAILDQPMLERS